MTEQERFLSFVSPEPNSGCWLWTGCDNGQGYGLFRPSRSRKMTRAHRYSYEATKGPIPEGFHLDHLCRVRCCVNPDHLEPVSCRENIRRGLTGANSSLKTHCPQGHEYSAANVYLFRGKRGCRACRRNASRKTRRSV